MRGSEIGPHIGSKFVSARDTNASYNAKIPSRPQRSFNLDFFPDCLLLDYFFFDKDVEHEESAYVGTRTEDGSIDWIDKAYSDDELDLDDDGDGIYTKYQTVSA